MTDVFIGQILLAGFDYAPKGFARCDGQLLPIAQNQALFSLLGARYGGNGTTIFALPDLRGRTPVGFAASADPAWRPPSTGLGEVFGQEGVTLTPGQIPPHAHAVAASTVAADSRVPSGRAFAASTGASGPGLALYADAGGPQVALNAQSVSSTGSGQRHPNMQPSATINACVALAGIFPSRG
ncbi:MAG TPA: tail fiber protein [Luteimonas sp.]|nr:tail fiber protein [Luteimonas sp.]